MKGTPTSEGLGNAGLELKIARLRTGLKQYQLAAELGITPTHLCEIETGRRQPSPALLARIVEVIQGEHNGEKRQQE